MTMLFRTLVALAFATAALAAPLPLDGTAPISRDVANQVQEMSPVRRESGPQGSDQTQGTNYGQNIKIGAVVPYGAATWGSTSQAGYTNSATSTFDNEVHSGTASNFGNAIAGNVGGAGFSNSASSGSNVIGGFRTIGVEGNAHAGVGLGGKGGSPSSGNSVVGGFETTGNGVKGSPAHADMGLDTTTGTHN